MYPNIRKTIEEIKFYLPIIFILPPLLGGIWQLVELFSIDPSYIRFFSATQLLPDGLLMLLILIVSTPLLGIIFILHKGIPNILDNKEKVNITTQSNLKHFYILKNKQSKIEYNSKCKKQLSWGVLIVLILIVVGNVWLLYTYLKKDELMLFEFLIRIFLTFLLLSVIIFEFTQKWQCTDMPLINKIRKNKIFFHIPTFIYGIIVMIVDFIVIILVPLLIVISIHQVYLFPDDLLNIKNIDNKIDKKYKSSKLLYINDKYIFIEHLDINKSKSIQIIKFDVLFDEIKKKT